MPLESLGRDGKLNIKKVETSAPQQNEFEFDFRKEVTPEIWDAIKERWQKKLNEYYEFTSEDTGSGEGFEFKIFLSSVVELVQLLPERRAELVSDPKLLRIFKLRIERLKEKSQFRYLEEESRVDSRNALRLLTYIAGEAKILFPNLSLEQLGIDTATLENSLSNVQRDIQYMFSGFGKYSGFLSSAKNLLIIAPEYRDKLDLSDETYARLVDGIISKTKFDLSQLYDDIRLVFPGKISRDDLAVSTFSEKLHKKLIYLKKIGNWSSYSSMLFEIRMLTADEVTLTGQGVIFKDHLKAGFIQESPPVPELKK